MTNFLASRVISGGRLSAAAALAVGLVWSAAGIAGPTLDAVKARGSLVCGVSAGLMGFSQADASGNYAGLDVDMCRAVATAILGAPKVKYVPLTTEQRYPALRMGQIDLLSRNSTITLQNEAGQGLLFGPIVFYDGQGILVPKKLNVKSAKQLPSETTICLQAGSTSVDNFNEYVKATGLKVKTQIVPILLGSSLTSGQCDGFSSDASGLAVMRAGLATPGDYTILPERLSREPLAPAVRNIDVQFYEIVRWAVLATIEADQLKVTSKNVDEALSSDDAKVKRFLGVIPGNGAALGLDEKFAYNIVKQVGNYNEIFMRNLGALSTVKLERGLNDGWTVGGLIFSPPFR